MVDALSRIIYLPVSAAALIVAVTAVGAYVFAMPVRQPIEGVPGLEKRRSK
jgi:nitrate reductase NapE component